MDDTARAREFYEGTLGLEVVELPEVGLMEITIANGGKVLVYPKENHSPRPSPSSTSPLMTSKRSSTS